MALSCLATMGAIAFGVGVGFILALVDVMERSKEDSWLSQVAIEDIAAEGGTVVEATGEKLVRKKR